MADDLSQAHTKLQAALGQGASEGFLRLLKTGEVRSACLDALKEAGCSPPSNHVVFFLLEKSLLAGSSLIGAKAAAKLSAYLQGWPAIAKLVAKIVSFDDRARSAAEVRESLVADLKAANPDITVDPSVDLDVVAALHQRTAIEGLDATLQTALNELSDDFAALMQASPQPELRWTEQQAGEKSASDAIKYNSGLYPFQGRNGELDLLQRFLGDMSIPGDANAFRWMLLTGPGGEGKTRLAKHFTEELCSDGRWNAGPLAQNQLREWGESAARWRPSKPTLLVIDYPAQSPKRVRGLLSDLQRTALDFDHPVRVLLLEREAAGEWHKTVFDESAEGAAIRSHVYGGAQRVNGVPIGPLDPEAIIALMKARFENDGIAPPPDGALIGAAVRVDPRPVRTPDGQEGQAPPRALFAAAAAEILLRAGANAEQYEAEIAGLDRDTVLHSLIERDRTMRWRPAAKDDEEALQRNENLLALACMTLGLEMETLASHAGSAAQLLPNANFPHAGLRSAMTGPELSRSAALEPDILGEFFALERLKHLPAPARQALCNAAFAAGEDETGVFALRCLRDFPERIEALNWFTPNTEAGAEAAAAFAGLAVDLTNLLGEAGRFESIDALAASVDALRADFDQNEDIALRSAMAAMNLTNHAGEVRDWVRVDAALARIDALRADFDQNEDIALRSAMAAVNVTSDAGKAEDWARVNAALERIDALRADFDQNEDIALESAKAAVNVTSDAGKAEDWARVDAALERIDALRADFDQNEDIALQSATVGANVANHAGKAEDWARVDAALARIDGLRTEFVQNENIALESARAAVNDTNHSAKAGNSTRVAAMAVRIRALCERFSENRELLAMCAHGLIAAYAVKAQAGEPVEEGEAEEIVARARLRVIVSSEGQSQFGVGPALAAIKDAHRHFPDNNEIAEVYDWAVKAGVDFDEVSDLRP
ncbi:MAG: hypothetical protein AAFX09_04110 [Pseudomonadota bacterium]